MKQLLPSPESSPFEVRIVQAFEKVKNKTQERKPLIDVLLILLEQLKRKTIEKWHELNSSDIPLSRLKCFGRRILVIKERDSLKLKSTAEERLVNADISI